MSRKFMKLAGVLVLAAMPVTGPALAQAVATAGMSVPFVTEQPANERRQGVPRSSGTQYGG